MNWEFVVTGMLFGLASGLTPGPLTALVIAETLRHDVKHGLQVAVSPALTDAPIVTVAILLLARLGRHDPVLGAIYLAGAALLFWLGWSTLRADPAVESVVAARPRSLLKGVLANVLNPHPYLFWATVGGPVLLQAAGVGWASAVAFLVAHYGLMIGSKMVLAVVVGRGRAVLNSRIYRFVLRALGLVLVGYGALFLREGIGRLG